MSGKRDPQGPMQQIWERVGLIAADRVEELWAPVVGAVRERLLTPFGLRSLAPGETDYKTAGSARTY